MCQNKPYLIIGLLLMLAVNVSQAQLCQNSTDTIYGLNSIIAGGSGQISGINVNTGGTATIGSSASGSANANGLGYSTVTNLFYFFNRTANNDTTEFVSFNPLSGVKTSLAKPSSPVLPTDGTGKMRSGAVNANGNAYYTIFPGASTTMGYPVTGPAFYYYNIPGNNWVLITQSFKDISNHTVNEIKNLNSGDMAFDGFGRLWIVCSSSSNYAMYRIDNPLPTTAVASIIVDTIIASKPTPAGVSITGIAFNSSGSLFLSSGSGGGAGNNQLYKMTMVSTPLTTVGTLPNGVGDDLASCISPFVVLPTLYFQFNTQFKNNSVQLIWKTEESNNDILGYEVEQSNDNRQWKKIAFAPRNMVLQDQRHNYNDYNYEAGNNYYRIAQLSTSGKIKYSAIQQVVVSSSAKANFSISSNNNVLTIYGKNLPTKYSGQIFDNSGRMVSNNIYRSNQTIDIDKLQKGIYFIKLFDSNQQFPIGEQKFIKY